MAKNRIRELREAAGLSVRAAAKRLGVSHVSLGRYESGEVKPRVGAIIEMAKAYKVSQEEVVACFESKTEAPDAA